MPRRFAFECGRKAYGFPEIAKEIGIAPRLLHANGAQGAVFSSSPTTCWQLPPLIPPVVPAIVREVGAEVVQLWVGIVSHHSTNARFCNGCLTLWMPCSNQMRIPCSNRKNVCFKPCY